MVPGFDPNHQGVAKQLGAITAAALLPCQTSIDGKQPQIGMVSAPVENPQSKTSGGPCGLRLRQNLKRRGGVRQL